MERASQDDGDVGDPSVAIIYFLALWGSAEKIISSQEITFQNFPWKARHHSHSPICYGTYRFTIWVGKWNSNVQSEDLSGT